MAVQPLEHDDHCLLSFFLFFVNAFSFKLFSIGLKCLLFPAGNGINLPDQQKVVVNVGIAAL